MGLFSSPNPASHHEQFNQQFNQNQQFNYGQQHQQNQQHHHHQEQQQGQQGQQGQFYFDQIPSPGNNSHVREHHPAMRDQIREQSSNSSTCSASSHSHISYSGYREDGADSSRIANKAVNGQVRLRQSLGLMINDLRVCLSVCLFLYTDNVGILIHMEWYIRHIWCSSVILYNITSIDITTILISTLFQLNL